MMRDMTPEHCKAARFLLGWTLRDLAVESGVNRDTCNRFELGRQVHTRTIRDIQRAFEDAGVRFQAPRRGRTMLPKVVLEDGWQFVMHAPAR